MKNRKVYITGIILLIMLMVVGGTYAYWTWYSPVSKNIVFNTASGIADYIIYDEGESKFVGDFQVGSSYLDGIHSTISISKNDKAANTELYATVNLTIEEIGEVMQVSNALKWAITTGDSNEDAPVVLNSGTFYGKNKDDIVRLYSPIILTTEVQKFTVWLWIDEGENPSEELSGETIDVRLWTQIDQMLGGEFSVTEMVANYQMVKATVVNPDANIVSYAVTRDNLEPSEWINIDSSDIGTLYRFNYEVEETGVYYIWFKDSNGKVISESVNVTEVKDILGESIIKAIKKDTNNEVESGNWSNKGLNYVFELEDDTSEIYYCMDTSNTCVPSKETGYVKPNTLVTTYNQEEGIYYIRYKTISLNGEESEVLSYNAKVGFRPDGTITVIDVVGRVTVSLSIDDPIVPVNPVYGWKISNDNTCDSSVVGFQESSDNPYTFSDVAAGRYYVCVRVTDSASGVYYYLSDVINTSSLYNYTGDYQLFTAPSDGYYQLEVWGAQGGDAGTYITGGYGGYSTGIVHLDKGKQLYVYVGGAGQDGIAVANTTTIGGYNGGGDGYITANAYPLGAGGGATDIRYFGSTQPSESDLVWNSEPGLNSRIIVAGGGGGVGRYTDVGKTNIVGHGGGYIGVEAKGTSNAGNESYASGGTQTGPGEKVYTKSTGEKALGGFGYGGQYQTAGVGGGGGGWYGGNACSYSGGGGSGYIASDMLESSTTILKHMTCYNCETSDYYTTMTNSTNTNSSATPISDYVKQDDGAVKITYIGSEIEKDTTPPTGEITLSLSDNTITATINATDASGVSSLYGYKISKDSTCDSSIIFTESSNNTYSFTTDSMGTYYVCARIIDKAGNYGYISSSIEMDTVVYSYTGNYQVFTVPMNGYYKIDTCGGQGGNSNTISGGKGGCASGIISLSSNDKLYVYVGGQGQDGANEASRTAVGGYNGGGTGYVGTTAYYVAGGGGATDIRYFGSTQPTESDLVWNSELGLNSRIIVAGGGGGVAYNTSTSKTNTIGHGGRLIGNYSTGTGSTGTEYTASTGEQSKIGDNGSKFGGFGYGANGTEYAECGGGGGWYGGNTNRYAGAGGSSFMSGLAGVNAITSSSSRTHTNNTLHYSNKYFIDGELVGTKNTGNGNAKITYIGSDYERKNTVLDNVRYIKDCINGHNSGTGNSWNEIQAIKNGINIALNKNVTGTGTLATSSNYTYTYESVVDGDFINLNSNAYISDTGLHCTTVDLGGIYSLDEVSVWHYWQTSGRIYNDNVTYVSADNSNWTIAINKQEAETAYGKRFNAWDEVDASVVAVANLDQSISVVVGGLSGNISSYCVNTSSSSVSDCSWINVNTTSFTTGIYDSGIYYVHVKDSMNILYHSSKVNVGAINPITS